MSTRTLEWIIERLLFLCAALSVLTTAGIISVLALETFEFLREVSIVEFLTGTEWTPLFANQRFGVVPLVGVPTVVYGYFALTFVTPLLQRVFPSLSGFNALSPGLVMGLMILPLVSSLSEDAMRAVPQGLREGSYALGATRMQTALKVVVPAAFSGITAAFILAVSRAIGETMIVAIAAGQQPRLTLDPTVGIETMTTYIVQVSMGDTPQGTLEYRTIFAV